MNETELNGNETELKSDKIQRGFSEILAESFNV